MLYVPILTLAGIAYVLVHRSATLPLRAPTWVLIYLHYESSELHGEAWSIVATAAFLMVPAALWVHASCFYLWPRRGGVTSGQAAGASEPGMSVPVNTVCAALSVARAAVVTFAFHLPHPNWAIWSSLTVIRPERVLSDRIGRKPLLLGTALGLLGLAWPLFWLMHHPAWGLTLVGQLGLAILLGLYAGAHPATMAEAFPAWVRVRGVSVAYNLSLGVLGGTTPIVITSVLAWSDNPLTPAYYR
jgi:hypothetical protein